MPLDSVILAVTNIPCKRIRQRSRHNVHSQARPAPTPAQTHLPEHSKCYTEIVIYELRRTKNARRNARKVWDRREGVTSCPSGGSNKLCCSAHPERADPTGLREGGSMLEMRGFGLRMVGDRCWGPGRMRVGEVHGRRPGWGLFDSQYDTLVLLLNDRWLQCGHDGLWWISCVPSDGYDRRTDFIENVLQTPLREGTTFDVFDRA